MAVAIMTLLVSSALCCSCTVCVCLCVQVCFLRNTLLGIFKARWNKWSEVNTVSNLRGYSNKPLLFWSFLTGHMRHHLTYVISSEFQLKVLKYRSHSVTKQIDVKPNQFSFMALKDYLNKWIHDLKLLLQRQRWYLKSPSTYFARFEARALFFSGIDAHVLYLNNEQAVRNNHLSGGTVWWSLHWIDTHTHTQTYRGSKALSMIQRGIKGSKLSWQFNFISRWANILFPSLSPFQITFCREEQREIILQNRCLF